MSFAFHGEQRLMLENCSTDGASFEQPLKIGAMLLLRRSDLV